MPKEVEVSLRELMFKGTLKSGMVSRYYRNIVTLVQQMMPEYPKTWYLFIGKIA